VPVAVVPFTIHYELGRRERLWPFLHPWLPCLAPCLGFSIGVVVLAFEVSPWFLPSLALPLFISRNFLRGAARILRRRVEPVDVTVGADAIERAAGGERVRLPLAGVIQVYRDGDRWDVLHEDGTELSIPAAALTAQQLDFLKDVALRAAAARRARE
jgi:hypothetical protein